MLSFIIEVWNLRLDNPPLHVLVEFHNFNDQNNLQKIYFFGDSVHERMRLVDGGNEHSLHILLSKYVNCSSSSMNHGSWHGPWPLRRYSFCTCRDERSWFRSRPLSVITLPRYHRISSLPVKSVLKSVPDPQFVYSVSPVVPTVNLHSHEPPSSTTLYTHLLCHTSHLRLSVPTSSIQFFRNFLPK